MALSVTSIGLLPYIVRVDFENFYILRMGEAFFSRSCQTLVLTYFRYAEFKFAVWQKIFWLLNPQNRKTKWPPYSKTFSNVISYISKTKDPRRMILVSMGRFWGSRNPFLSLELSCWQQLIIYSIWLPILLCKILKC